MYLIVQKFGGTSLSDVERIKSVSHIIKNELNFGNKVVVVVSAMSGITNQLIGLCNDVSNLHDTNNLAEYDNALSSGEIVTSSLLSLALQELGIKARSILSWQLPIMTNSCYSKALVERIDDKLLLECLNNSIVPVIAGFQGIDQYNRVTTFGRGGSDITALLISALIKADRCDIYTDVSGVFTADPRIVHNAKQLNKINFQEMLMLALSGAKVLHARCVSLAIQYNIPIQVLSSFNNTVGTLVTSSEEENMERNIITSITYNKNLLQLSIINSKLSLCKLSSLLLKEDIQIKFSTLNRLNESMVYIFVLHLIDQNKIINLLDKLQSQNIIEDFIVNGNISMISVIGYGISNDNILLNKVIGKLQENCIEIFMFDLSDIKLSILIHDKHNELVIKILHDFFQLDNVSDDK